MDMPLCDIAAEKSLLSCMMNDNTIVKRVSLDKEDFYQSKHSIIFSVIKRLESDNKKVDTVTIKGELDAYQKKDITEDYLFSLSTEVIMTSGWKDYENIVKDKALLRQLKNLVINTLGSVKDEKKPEKIISDIINNSKKLQLGDMSQSIAVKDAVVDRFEEYMQRASGNTSNIEGLVPTHFFDDILSGGIEGGQLITIAARPAMGKSSLALSLSIEMSKKYSVGFLSLEMPNNMVVDRIISQVSEVPMTDIKSGNLDDDDLSNISTAGDELNEMKINIADSTSVNLQSIRKFLNSKDLDVLFVDYLQLLSGEGENRTQEVSKLSRGLKELAMEFNIPVIALSQLSRAVENRPDKRPRLADLRNSGAIEQDCDIVLMMYRDDYYDEDSSRKGITDIYVRKNRNGACGVVPLKFNQPIMRFEILPNKNN